MISTSSINLPSNNNEGIISRILRIGIKFAQLFTSLFLTISMYNIGPYWIFIAASLAIPLYGLFLIFKSPEHLLNNHPLPYIRYKALERLRSWLRVDLAICSTMAILCFLLSIILFIIYLLEHSINIFILSSASSSLFLAVLYSLNILLSARCLKIGSVDLFREKNSFIQQSPKLSTTWESAQSPQPTIILPSISNNNNNLIFENIEKLEENWRQIPIKQTITLSGENKNIIIEEEENDHCLRLEQRQRTPSGENIAMIFGRNKNYRQKEKNEKEQKLTKYNNNGKYLINENNEIIKNEKQNNNNNPIIYKKLKKDLKNKNIFEEEKSLEETKNEENINNKIKYSPIRLRRRYQSASSSSKNFEEERESPTIIERANSSSPYYQRHFQENEELSRTSPSYWKHQITEL